MAIAAVAGLAAGISASAAGLAFFSFAAGGFAAFAGYFAVGAGLSMLSRALAPKPNIGAQMRGITQTTREPASSRKIIYGRMRVGGQVVFISHSGDDNKYLNMAIVFATHEIEAYDEIWFNDNRVWDATNGFNGDWGTYVTIDRKFGTAGQAASTQLVNANSRWTTDHKLSGIAYIAFRLEWNADQFPQGVPNITAVIKGKKVYDPRTSTTSWSQNPALCLRDYMLDQSYGLGEVATNLNDTSISDAADLCDEQVGTTEGVPVNQIVSGVLYEITFVGTTDFTAIGASSNTVGVQFTATGAGTGTGKATRNFQTRYKCNGILDTANQIKANIEQLLSAMGGRLTYSGGEYFVDGAEYQTPTVTFTEADIVSDIQTQTKQSRRGIYNGVKGIFVSEEKNYKVLDYPAQISSTYEAEDGDPVYLDMPLPCVTNNTQAQRLAKIALLKSRQQVLMTMTTNLKGLRVKVGDTIQVTNDRLNYTSKVFEVIDYSLAITDGALGVNLTCIETAAALYDWNTSDEEDFLSGGELPLYDGRTVDNVTDLTLTEVGLLGPDGGVSSAVELEWTPVTDAFVELYKVRYNKTGTTDYLYASSREPRIYISGLDITSNYDFRVQAENLIGVSSSGESLLNQSLNGDEAAPDLPESLATTGAIRTITATWNNPDDIDLKQIEVHVVDTNTTPADGATPEAVITGEEYVYPTGTANAVTKYFFLRAVDYSGNKSDYTSGVAGTSLQVTSEDVGDGEIEGRTLALLLNQDASGNANAGEGALVGVNVDGTVNMNADGSVLYNGTNVTIEHDQYNNYTFLTQVAGKRGYIAFDLNKTAPFQMSGSFGDFNCAFVWSENDQFYYDVNNTSGSGATETAFDPSSFTGTTTGTDVNDGTSTTTAHIVALGTLETTSGGDNILSGGLFPEPLDISTTQIPDAVITGRTIVVNSITANKISGDISEVFNLGAFIYPSHTVPEGLTNRDVATTFTVPAPDSDLKKYASLIGRIKITTTTTVNTCILQAQFQRKSKGTTSGTDIGTLVGYGSIASNFHYLEVSGNKTSLVDTFGGLSTSQTSPSITVKPAAVEFRGDTDRTRIIYGYTSTNPAFTSGTIYYNADRWLSTSNWLEDASGTQDFIIPALTTNARSRTLTLNQALANSDALEEYRMRVNTEDKSAGTVKIVSIQSQIILNT